MQKKYKIGIVIGRFQPFHKGHKYLIKRALERVEKLYLGIGGANLKDSDNPYTSKKRVNFLKKFITEEGLSKNILGIVPLNNHPDDAVWLKKLLKKTGSVEVVIGNNEWVNGIFEDAGIPAIRIKHLKRHIYEGTKIRKLMRQNDKWEDRVPEYLVSFITNHDTIE